MGILLTEEEYEIVHKHEGHERTFVNVWTVEPYLKAQALKVLDAVIDLQHEFDLTDEFLNKLAEIRKAVGG